MTKSIRFSRTARDQFQILLAHGAEKFGIDLADQKRRLVEDCIANYLIDHPEHGLRDKGRSFFHHRVAKTPFTVVYDFDENELRILFIVHSRADRRRLDPVSVEW